MLFRSNEGVLKGFGVNAGANYRGHVKIGSRDAQIKFGKTNPTVAETAQAAYDYLWTSPTLSATVGANYTRRFGKLTARFQLNVANLLDDQNQQYTAYAVINANQLTPNLTAGSAGSNPRMQVRSNFNLPDPRKYTFTTTLNF